MHRYTESYVGMARVALVPNASTACRALQARSRALPENAFLQCTAQCLLQFSVNLQCTAFLQSIALLVPASGNAPGPRPLAQGEALLWAGKHEP